jgi:peptidyl-dipeptidase Dcp
MSGRALTGVFRRSTASGSTISSPLWKPEWRSSSREIDRIVANPDEPTFENTIAELERAGRTLDRVRTVYGIWSSNLNTPEVQAVQREMAPRLAAFSDRITQNTALFRRIESVYENREAADLTAEQQRLTWLYHTNFVRAGARLDGSAKARLSEINQRLAQLFTTFGQNVLSDEDEQYLVLESEADLAGLSDSQREAAASAAEEKGLAGSGSSRTPGRRWTRSSPTRAVAI